MITVDIISFDELSSDWQAEAIRNLDDQAQEAMYLEPNPDHTPAKHILWDLTEAVRGDGTHDGFKYNASIGISNNSAMLLNVDPAGEAATYIFA